MARSRNSVLPTAAAEVLEGLVKGVGGKALRGERGDGTGFTMYIHPNYSKVPVGQVRQSREAVISLHFLTPTWSTNPS